MSIADKLTQIAQNMQAVYEAGKAAGGGASAPNPLQYANLLRYTNVAFPVGYELTLSGENFTSLPELGGSTGIRKVTFHLPTGKSYSATSALYSIKSLEEIVFPYGINISSANYFCTSCYALRSITGALDMTGNGSSNMWQACYALENISFVPGTIGASLTFKNSSLLTDASIQSVIDGLAEVETEQTLTLHAAVGGKLTDAQKAAVTAKNWTLVY